MGGNRGDPPVVDRPNRFAPMVMYSIFHDGYGPLCQMAVPKGQSITSNYYATQVLTEVNNFYLKRRPKCGAKGIRLLHDNVHPHKTKLVKEKINDVGMIELEHPPYSPDISPFL